MDASSPSHMVSTHPHIPIDNPHQKAWAKWLLVATSLDAIRIRLPDLGTVLRSEFIGKREERVAVGTFYMI